MPASAHPPHSLVVRPLAVADVPALVELRWSALVEEADFGARAPLVTDARERVVASTRLLPDHEKVLVRVAVEPPADASAGPPVIVGFALGRAAVWPPIWLVQRVGEITSLFVVASRRDRGVPEALVTRVSDELARRGAQTIRSQVAWGDLGSRERFEAMGFTGMSRLLSRPATAEDGPARTASDAEGRLRRATPANVPSLVLLSMAMLEENGRADPRFRPHGEARAGEEVRLAQSVADPEQVVLVHEEKPGGIVGYAAGRLGRAGGLRVTPRPATLTAAYVVPSRRRQGIARRLAGAVAGELAALGAGELHLHVVARNADALAFWGALGYLPHAQLYDRPVA